MKSKNPKIQTILKKGIVSILITLMMLSPFASTNVAGVTLEEIRNFFANGNTTMYVRDETDLIALAEYVKQGNSCSGKTIILMNDISLASVSNWTPIGIGGTDYVPFQGTFDGNGFTISISITSSSYPYIGLFGEIGTNGKVRNLYINSSNINLNDEIYAGAIAGKNNGTISKCITKNSNISGKNGIGGIVAINTNTGTIEYCTNNANVKDTATSSTEGIGGIAGKNYGTITGCKNDGEIIGNNRVGGIVGYNTTVDGRIKNCTNYAPIEGKDYVGGIVGKNEERRIDNCTNSGEITGNSYVGGIAGSNEGEATIFKCHCVAEITGNNYVGGITGLNNNQIGQCRNVKPVYGTSSEAENLGGIAGKSTGKIYNCENVSTIGKAISGYVNVGGIAGINEGTVEKCKNSGSVSGRNNVGGIVGYDYYGKTISNSRNEGSVYGVFIAGGIAGRIDGSTVTHCEVAGYIDTYQWAGSEGNYSSGGGIAGYSDYPATISYCDVENVFIVADYCGGILGDTDVGATIFWSRLSSGVLEGLSNSTAGLVGHCTVRSGVDQFTALNIYACYASFETDSDPLYALATMFYTHALIRGCNWNIYSGQSVFEYRAVDSTVEYLNWEDTPETLQYVDKDEIGCIEDVGVTVIDYGDTTSGENKPSAGSANDNGKAPSVSTSIVPGVTNSSGRYMTGTEIIITVTSSEALSSSTTPVLQVNFSETGIGKYNSGKAKAMGKTESLNGLTEWKYIYIIQNADEGNLSVSYTGGSLKDLQGNTTNLSGKTVNANNIYADTVKPKISLLRMINNEITESAVTNSDEITYKITINEPIATAEVNEKAITVNGGTKGELSELTRNADGTYSATINVTPFVIVGNVGEVEIIVEEGAFKDLAGNLNVRQEAQIIVDRQLPTVEIKTNKQTINANESVIYEFLWSEGVNDFTIDDITVINGTKGTLTGEGNYYTLDVTSENGKDIKLSVASDVVVDVAGNANVQSSTHIIAVAPTVDITTDKTNPTNADEILYTFKFSEAVNGFTAEDITVNNGTKGELSEAIENEDRTYSYTMNIVPDIENEGVLQVIIEAGACQDLVGKDNVRTESNITIDKVKPVFNKYIIKEDAGKIVIETIFSEAIADASELVPTLKIGGNDYRGTWEEVQIDSNKATYVYNIIGSDGGKVEVSLNGTVKDAAGNSSEEINVVVENDITLEKHSLILGGIEYSFSKNNVAIRDFAQPIYFKANDKITVSKIDEDGNSTIYEYVVTGKYLNNTHIKYMVLTEAEGEETVGKVSFRKEAKEDSIEISEANIYFDTIAPTVGLTSYIELKNENNRYTKGQEIILIATVSERIQEEKEVPQLNVSFSESGLGKYNYQGENADTGNAILIETVENENGTVSFKYKYIVDEGDEGQLQIEYLAGKVVDLAGNETDIVNLYATKQPTSSYTDVKEFNGVEISSIKFYKDSSCREEINPIANTNQTSDIYIKVELDQKMYTDIRTLMNKDTALSLYLNGDIKTTIQSISNGKVLTYKYDKETVNSLTKIDYITLINEKSILYNEEQLVANAEGIAKGKKHTEDITDFNVDPLFVSSSVELNDIYADTTVPTVSIIAKNDETEISNNITNADVITYTFTWNEKVVGFTPEDITVNNGTKGTLSDVIENEDGTYSYTMDITPSTQSGNIGDIQVIVEQDACQDLVGHSNVRTEKVIGVDKKAPILQSLEAYASSNIKVNANVDVVKEYYKENDIITIVATFDENISGETNLTLNFSESGNLKETVNGVISGNKITYTYAVKEGNNGTLSVRSLNGTISDIAGNETKVTRKTLDGNAIIADTDIPSLKELKVVSPTTGTYKEGETIKIEAIYDEEIYALNNNEIKNITSELAPTLKVKFGNGAEKEATFSGYVGEDKTRLEYTVSIVNGDNGILSITSYTNKENVKVCDIAGNEATLNKNQTGNQITADTVRPEVTKIEANVVNPSIKDTGIYHKEGNTVKITLTFSEEVCIDYNNTSLIEFGYSESDEMGALSEDVPHPYIPVFSKTKEYTITINEGNNGYLWVKVPADQFRDIAGNGNVAESATRISNVFADTTMPTVTLYKDTTETQNNQTITVNAEFNENVFDLNGDRRIALTTANAPKLIYSFGVGENREIKATRISGNTITYTITKNAVEDNGDLHYELAKGNLCDRAGNELYTTSLDTTAPILESVVISTNAGKYAPYCKVGTEIYVTATFNEPIEAENMKLKAKIGEVEITELLDGQIVEANSRQIKFTYTVKSGDNGSFEIVDICGETDTKITDENADKTYGWVRDAYGNQNNIYSLEAEGIGYGTERPQAVADTKDPYITSIKAIANEKEVATYTKEEGKDAVITVGKTNANTVEYTVTYSEPVPYNHFENISIENGIIKHIEYTNPSLNQFKIIVQTTVEGVQSLIIGEGTIEGILNTITVEDKAGNGDSFVRLDAVTVDFTKPSVRFISEYNGGMYVLPTNVEKIEIRPNVEISEDIDKIEFKWKKLKDGKWEDIAQYAEVENYTSASDIAIDAQTFGEGNYKLYIKVIDLAGNEYETKEGLEYQIMESNINMNPNTYADTNQDVIVEITFGEGLTDNKKVVFKAVDSTEAKELNINEQGKYVVTENGTIYVDATDRVGNKVYNELSITNIDREKPEVSFELSGADLVIGTDKDKATIKTNVELTDNMTALPEGKYAFLQENHDVYSMTEEQKGALKAKITNELVREAKIEDAVSTKGNTPYYLYVLAVDNAGNETIAKSGEFTVVDTNPSNVTNDAGEESTIPAEIEINKLISFEQKGKDIYISYNNFSEDEGYLNIIREKEVSLTNDRDGYVDFEGYYVEVNGATTITVVGKDACGNEVIATYEVTRGSIEGPKFDVTGNPKDWTNQDVKLEVSCYEELSALTVNGTDILSKEEGVRSNKVVTQNGDYEFIATDTYGNISKKTITVSKIDKDRPVIDIENTKAQGKDITITANDEASGIKEYAISTTTEVPVEWSKSKVIKVTEDGVFYVWVKDNAGNISRAENTIVIDTTAPTVTLNYLSETITVGMPLEANIVTDEEAIISYSWDKENWVDSEELLTSLMVSEKSTTTGTYTLYAKAKDKFENESKVQTLVFNVVNMEEIKQPDIIFEDIPTIQVNGVKYVKVSPNTTVDYLTNRMNVEALCGKTPEYINLTEDGKLRTGSEITINGSTKYTIIVKGDINGDGGIDFIKDIIRANNYRLGIIDLSIPQILAADVNNNGKIEFIQDLIAINNFRLGLIKSL